MPRCLLTILSLILAMSLSKITADRIVTTRKHLKTSSEYKIDSDRSKISIIRDTIIHPQNKIRFCGYEKSLRATKETIFIENLCDSTISNIAFTIKYLDSNGRQLHQRGINLKTDIPPRNARRFDLKSWDTQKSFYYIYGEKPRKSATPYDITISADTIIITPCIQ